MPRRGRDRLNGYGDSMVCSPTEFCIGAPRPERDIAWMSNICDATAECWLMRRAGDDVTAVQGKSVRYRR